MAQSVADRDRHRIVMTCIVYDRNQKFLVTKRSKKQKVHPGKWTVPGGGLEAEDYLGKPYTSENAWYEVLEDALRREIKEEVNLEIDTPRYLTDLVFIRPDHVPVLVLSYYAKCESGEVKLEEDDADEFKWVTVSEAKEMDFIPGIVEEIQMVEEILNGNPNPRLKF